MTDRQGLVAVVTDDLAALLSQHVHIQRASDLTAALLAAKPTDSVIWSSYEPVGAPLGAGPTAAALALPGQLTAICRRDDRALGAWARFAETRTAFVAGELGVPGLAGDDPLLGDLVIAGTAVGFKRSVLAVTADGSLRIAGAHARVFTELTAEAPVVDPKDGYSAWSEIAPALAYKPTHYPLVEVELGPVVCRSGNPIAHRHLRSIRQRTISLTLMAVCHTCGAPALTWGGTPQNDQTVVLGRCEAHPPVSEVALAEVCAAAEREGVSVHVNTGPMAMASWQA